ncbi:hypothetical protein [Bacillus paramycoides]|uniref:hypothetical protein n=1 Tax=Bacillus paramycoides TaxID=2026194 RepID=UPI002E20CE85|nr:hypothetical protein [Bacillus paramycoides]
MSYTEWYENKYGDKWTDNHAVLMSVIGGYEGYCNENNIKPIWNGLKIQKN